MYTLASYCRGAVSTRAFEWTIVVLIFINALIIGLETVPQINASYGSWLAFGNYAILAGFVVEVAMKILACAPRYGNYFRSSWNIFDFIIIVLSLIPFSGTLATVARLVRILRTLRLLSTLPKMRLLVNTLVLSLPSIGHIVFLFSILAYMYAVAGVFLFRDIDPVHWGSLGVALLSLFEVVTLEGWGDLMRKVLIVQPLAWIYFISFIVIGTFVVVNLFIAIVLNNLEEAREEKIEQDPHNDVLIELRAIREKVQRLEENLLRAN